MQKTKSLKLICDAVCFLIIFNDNTTAIVKLPVIKKLSSEAPPVVFSEKKL